MTIKHFIKTMLARLGFVHPSLGIKINREKKADILLQHKTQDIKVFVETGTETGWMIEKIGNRFERVYSIELDETLHRKAQERFRNDGHVTLLQGDSALLIKKVLEELREPALFWLDSHWSGTITVLNAPVVRELEAIFANSIRGHTVVIDDARHFDRATIQVMKNMVKEHNYTFRIEDGIFRLLPKYEN